MGSGRAGLRRDVSWLPWWPNGWECRRHVFNPWSRKIPHASEQLNLCTTTMKPSDSKVHTWQQDKPLQWEVCAAKKSDPWGAVLRWQRNRMGRPLSPPQIHQKIIWMLSNFHKTTSECWWRTPGTQKGSPFSSKGGRTNIKDKKRDKRVRDGDPFWGGSHEGEVSKQ